MRRAVGWTDDYDGRFYVYRLVRSPLNYGWGLVGVPSGSVLWGVTG